MDKDDDVVDSDASAAAHVAIGFERDGLLSLIEAPAAGATNTSSGAGNGLPWHRDADLRTLLAMLTLVGAFALAELVGGAWSGSLALLSDAFHMLSDFLALAVALAALRLAKRAQCNYKSYGWQRAEVIGALVNGVFLASSCFFVLLEAATRVAFATLERVSDAPLLLAVGVAGLLVNVLGLALIYFRNCTRSAGPSVSFAVHSHGHGHGHSSSMNMHGVLLHVLGDALGSLVVIAVALCNWWAPADALWVVYIDPACSALLALIVLRSAVPLIRRSSGVLMQSVPPHVDLAQLRADVLAIDGVAHVHALHVWQLTERRAIGSLHVACSCAPSEFDALCRSIKRVLHAHDVHHSAVQPEFTHGNGAENYFARYGCADGDSCCEMSDSDLDDASEVA